MRGRYGRRLQTRDCHTALGRLLLCHVGPQEIGAYQARRKKEKAGARTLNKELQVLRQILKKYELWSDLQGEVQFEREQAGIGKALTPDAEKRLLESSESNPLLYTVVTLALHTALRKNEIRTLRLDSTGFLPAYIDSRGQQNGRK